MQISNLHQFTENHRYTVYRDFSLSPSDRKVLYSLYQPMIGSRPIVLYTMLHQQIPAEQVGFSPLEQQRKLFLLQHILPNEQGRQLWVEDTSSLEAVGLLQTYRQELTHSDETVFVYRLQCPQSLYNFFQNEHLALLLRDKVGKRMLAMLKKELHHERPKELADFDQFAISISTPFYELFKLNARESVEPLPDVSTLLQSELPVVHLEGEFSYESIITRFPRDSDHRVYVEGFKTRHDQLTTVNYVAKKYRLSLRDTCRLLDEEGIFTAQGELDVDELQRIAYMHYLQDVKTIETRDQIADRAGRLKQPALPEEEKTVDPAYYLEVPELLQTKCNIQQYNMMLRNEPYTKVLERFFPGTVPRHVSDIFAKVDLNYKLPEEVINVLIHYLKMYQLSWNKAFIDSIVSDLLGKQVDAYEKAVQYIRDRTNAAKNKQNSRTGKGTRTPSRGSSSKPSIPIITNQHDRESVPMSEEEYERVLKKMQQYEENWSNTK